MTNDQHSRFSNAAEEARGKFANLRARFGAFGRSFADEAAVRLSAVRSWSARRLPGGEKTLWITLSLVLLALFIWAILPGKEKPQVGRYGMGGPQPVNVAAAVKGDITVTLNALGTVTPLATVTVRPQVSGQLVNIAFREGQMLKAGDLIAEIDSRSFRAALDQAHGQLARDSAALANARLDLKRQQSLLAARATSQQALDTQAALVKQYEGAVMADRGTVAEAAINFGYTRVTSPVAGRAGIRQVDVGNFVSAGQTTGIVVVTQLDPISVLFTVPEDSVGDVISRLDAGELLPVEAYDRSQTVKIATGALAAVDTQVDTTTGTVKLRAMFDNGEGKLFPNQFVNVRLLVATLHNQVIVPAAAVQRGAEGTFVFVVKPDNTATMRTVTLGVQQSDRVAVIKGLNPGETVVTDGADSLREGSKVTIPSGQQVAAVKPAQNATALPNTARAGRRSGFMALFRKLTDKERDEVCALERQDRRDWFSKHREEMLKRPDRQKPAAPCEGMGGPGGPGGPPPGGPPPG